MTQSKKNENKYDRRKQKQAWVLAKGAVEHGMSHYDYMLQQAAECTEQTKDFS